MCEDEELEEEESLEPLEPWPPPLPLGGLVGEGECRLPVLLLPMPPLIGEAVFFGMKLLKGMM